MPWDGQGLLGLDEIAVGDWHKVVSLALVDYLRGLQVSRHRLDCTRHRNLEATPVTLVWLHHGGLRPHHALRPVDKHNLLWLRLGVSERLLEHLVY